MYSVNVPQPRLRNDAYYYELLACPTTSHLTTATIDDKSKLEFQNSVFSVDLVTNSYKYGCELQFKSYTTSAPKVKPRVDKEHGYFRLECGYLPGTHETADLLRTLADQIDAIICYEPVTFQADPRPVRVLDKDFRLEDVLI